MKDFEVFTLKPFILDSEAEIQTGESVSFEVF